MLVNSLGTTPSRLDREAVLDLLEEEIAAHSGILAWRIPWTEEPSRLHPWGHKELHTTEQLSTCAPDLLSQQIEL